MSGLVINTRRLEGVGSPGSVHPNTTPLLLRAVAPEIYTAVASKLDMSGIDFFLKLKKKS